MHNTVVGIDVGGLNKGFHAVAIRNGHEAETFAAGDVNEITLWCLEIEAQAIGVDSPCRWSTSGRVRVAELALAQRNALVAGFIHCFATPSFEIASSHPKNFYGWVLNGANLYRQLEKHYPLFNGRNAGTRPICFETFPQAVACALAGKVVSAKQKRKVRRELLTKTGIDISSLSNIDMVDAALCALAAHRFLSGEFKAFGDATEGYIVVPQPDLSVPIALIEA